MNARRRLVVGLLCGCWGCTPGADTPTLPPADAPLIAAAVTDFQSGALWVVDRDTRLPYGPLALLSADPLLRRVGDQLWVLERGGGDVVRAFGREELLAPLWERALPADCNAHDALLDGELVWVPCYDLPVVLGLSLAGELVVEVDLSASAEGPDGLAEVDRVLPGGLVVAQRLDRTAGWAPTEGQLVWLDGAQEALALGPNPRDGQLVGEELVVLTGRYGLLDGGLVRADVGARTVAEAAPSEAELGVDFEAYLPVNGSGVLLGARGDGQSDLWCLDASGQVLASVVGEAWMPSGLVVDQRVWVGLRATWSGAGTAAPGLRALDPERCAWDGPLVPTDLGVYSVAAW